jgi:predicted nucleic acid-binding protein
MKPKVYIETSIISYLTARLSNDLVVAGQQKITQEWWDNQRSSYQLYTSQIVLNEAKLGDSIAAAKRLQALQGIELLDVNNEAITLAGKLQTLGALPLKAVEDAYHIAIATVHQMNYLFTWNCKHIANPHRRLAIEQINHQYGYQTPILCTPMGLLGGP